jgi:hypothetical protein
MRDPIGKSSVLLSDCLPVVEGEDDFGAFWIEDLAASGRPAGEARAALGGARPGGGRQGAPQALVARFNEFERIF